MSADRGPETSVKIKHDGYRLMVRRDGDDVRLLTRRGYDFTDRFPLIVKAAQALRVPSCLIDGEAVACDDNGVASFQKLRRRHAAIHYAFDLIEHNGIDLRQQPLEVPQGATSSPS